MDVYTAQIRYSGPGRLDITVKGQDSLGKFFAPTWAMVRGLKDGTLPPDWYKDTYHKILSEVTVDVWSELQSRMKAMGNITLVCYCPPGAFCHRVLLAQFMENRGLGSYIGERKL